MMRFAPPPSTNVMPNARGEACSTDISGGGLKLRVRGSTGKSEVLPDNAVRALP